MKIVDKAGRIFEMIDNIMAYLAGLLVVFIGATTLYEVCLRKVFWSPSLWAFEIVENAMLFLTFLGATLK